MRLTTGTSKSLTLQHSQHQLYTRAMRSKRGSSLPGQQAPCDQRKGIFIVTLILIILCVIEAWMVLNDKYMNSIVEVFSNSETHVHTLKFTKYLSSEYETQWVENIQEWQKVETYCKVVQQQKQTIETFLQIRDKMMNGTPMNQIYDTYTQETVDYIFSKFVYQCGPEKIVSYIEPLFTSLRHPKSFCLLDDKVWLKAGGWLSREYIVLDDKVHQMKNDESGRFGSCLNAQRANDDTRQQFDSFYFDIGASLYNQGAGGASQKWFIENYNRSNIAIQFDNILLWEARKYNPARIFDQVPVEILPYYQYFNVPAITTSNNTKNPFNILKKVVKRKTDYVMVKLDMDHPSEFQFIEKILREPELQETIDEMFFEHHVAFRHAIRSGWRGNHDPTKTLGDSYNVFLKLREAGIRMHGWP